VRTRPPIPSRTFKNLKGNARFVKPTSGAKTGETCAYYQDVRTIGHRSVSSRLHTGTLKVVGNIVRHQTNIVQATSREGFTELASIERSNRKVIGTVRYEFMTATIADSRVMNQKDARHAFDVAIRHTEKIATRRCDEHSSYSAGIQILAPFGVNEAECLVEAAIGVRKPRDIAKMMRGKEFFARSSVDR